MRGAPTRQGAADALCGIYCLLHFLRHKSVSVTDASKSDRDSEFLMFLLEAAGRQSLFTPYHIAGGYYAHDLVLIFNDLCKALELPLKAEGFQLLRQRGVADSVPEIVGSAVSEGGAAIVLVSEIHWVLATGINGKTLSIVDSFDVKRKTARLANVSTQQGLILLDNNRAQTH